MAENEKKKTKLPTAKKRDKQNVKRRQKNRVFKTRVKTATKNLLSSIENKENVQENLNTFYSLMDKGVKKKIIKKNRANRLKSNYFTKSNA